MPPKRVFLELQCGSCSSLVVQSSGCKSRLKELHYKVGGVVKDEERGVYTFVSLQVSTEGCAL